MNELLQRHGCSNVFSMPEGLKELMCDISREVLREQPEKIFDFIANYLSVLLITREHGVLAMKILEDLCDCKPSVSEHLMHLGMMKAQAETLSQVIQEEIEGFEPVEGKEKVKESQIVKKILARAVLDEDMTARVCQVARNAYRDYWYRKKLLEKSMKVQPDEPWEIAAQHTLELYKRTKPSYGELTRATQKIQAAYRGYHVRKNLLTHLKPKKKKMRPKVDLLGPPVDVAASREIDLGPILDVKVREDDVGVMFEEYAGEKLGLRYDPMKTITHVEEQHLADVTPSDRSSRMISQVPLTRVDDVAESRHSRLPQLEASRQSQSELKRHASIGPAVSQEMSLHKISFLEAPPELIPDAFEETVEDEAQPVKEDLPEAQEDLEVQEAQGVEPAEAVEGEAAESAPAQVAQEVPEELPGDEPTEGDASSAPTASVPSSAPDTADNTDVEDAGEAPDTTGDEGGG